MSNVLGIDVSKWQDDNSTAQMMNFDKSKSSGARFVFIKASQAQRLDPDYILNWAHAGDSGLPRGGYCFMDWSAKAIDQARFFGGILKADPGELPPVLDFECRTNAPVRSIAVQEAWIFVQEVQQILGRNVMLYTSPSYWKEFGETNLCWTNIPLWIANYYVAKPTIPAPWKDWLFWQWSPKGNGLKFGAESKDLDMDYYNGDEISFNAAFDLVHIPAVEERVSMLEREARVHGWNV